MCIFLGHNGTRTLTCFSPVVGWRGLAWHGGTHSNANLTGVFWDTIIEATVLLYYPVPTNQSDHPQTRGKKRGSRGQLDPFPFLVGGYRSRPRGAKVKGGQARAAHHDI